MQQHFTFMIDETGEFDWRIDDHTREVGRMGIASARQTLASCGHDTTDSSIAA